jgi:hypothetical protein
MSSHSEPAKSAGEQHQFRSYALSSVLDVVSPPMAWIAVAALGLLLACGLGLLWRCLGKFGLDRPSEEGLAAFRDDCAIWATSGMLVFNAPLLAALCAGAVI